MALSKGADDSTLAPTFEPGRCPLFGLREEWRREGGDDRRRWVAVDRRRGWLDFGGVAQSASSDGGGRKGRPNSSNRNPNPSFDPLRSISPIYGSFSLDRGGWSLTLSYY